MAEYGYLSMIQSFILDENRNAELMIFSRLFVEIKVRVLQTEKEGLMESERKLWHAISILVHCVYKKST